MNSIGSVVNTYVPHWKYTLSLKVVAYDIYVLIDKGPT